MLFPRSMTRRSLQVLAGAAIALSAATAPTFAAEPPCTYEYSFEQLQNLIPKTIGQCLDDESYDPDKGVASQVTNSGVLLWRRSDNKTAFTDGSTAWLLGPDGNGLASRTSTSPLKFWEGPTAADTAADTRQPLLSLPSGVKATAEQAYFILRSVASAQVSQRETGVPSSITIAQAILESDWGKSRLSAVHNNYFGIKARGETDPARVAWYPTWEVVDGEDVVELAPFRAYANAAESFTDHGHFFLKNRRYAAAMAVKHDPREFAREINKAGYATDPNYSKKLIALMDRFNLYSYDVAK